MTTTTTTELDLMDITCPDCEAGPGRWCWDLRFGRPRTVLTRIAHMGRAYALGDCRAGEHHYRNLCPPNVTPLLICQSCGKLGWLL